MPDLSPAADCGELNPCGNRRAHLFTRVAQNGASRYGADPFCLAPASTRVFFLAMGRLNEHGHAHFTPGELAHYLATVEPRTGEVQPASKDAPRRAVERAVREGLVLPGSTPRLVLLDRSVFGFRPAGAGARACRECQALDLAARRKGNHAR